MNMNSWGELEEAIVLVVYVLATSSLLTLKVKIAYESVRLTFYFLSICLITRWRTVYVAQAGELYDGLLGFISGFTYLCLPDSEKIVGQSPVQGK